MFNFSLILCLDVFQHLHIHWEADPLRVVNFRVREFQEVICSDIETIASPIALGVYPNPFHIFLQIELPGLHSGPTDVRIFDATGKMVWQQAVQLFQVKQQIVISVEKLEAGSSIISLSNPDIHLNQTIIKL